jgi:hypothetical protein
VNARRHDPNPSLEGWRASADKCPGLIGVGFGIEADTDKRCCLCLDSIVMSGSES